ncbi:MAG: TetR/AcrR family transcriptional regulator [Deltaproteobacteria bacterium]|nr:TetR/AcrR family transcriptional regulator [Deltaproteobacteria bacterium]
MARANNRRGGTLRRRAARLEPDKRRAQLLDCAFHVIAKAGAQAASAATVAEEAGVSEATVFKYFPDKRALNLAVIERLGAHFRSIFDRIEKARKEALDVLVDYAVAFAAELERHPEYARLLLDQGAALLDPSLRQVIESNVTEMAQRVEKTIRRGITEGSIRAEVDAEIAAWIYVGNYSSLAQAKVFGRPAEWIYRVQLTSLQGLIRRPINMARGGKRVPPSAEGAVR